MGESRQTLWVQLKPLFTVPLTFIAAWMVCSALVLGVYGLVVLLS